jgi:hypothetical protein
VASDHNDGPHRPAGDAQTLIQHAALVWAQARDATSSEARVEFERLALLYERLAVRAARRNSHRSTLGDFLYANKGRPRRSGADWIALIQQAARRDQRALQTLYVRTHYLVFALIMRITNHALCAEKLTLDLFCDVWQGAGTFDPLADTVIGWMANCARSRALELLRMKHPTDGRCDETPVVAMANWPIEAIPFSAPLWRQIAQRITRETNDPPLLNATCS